MQCYSERMCIHAESACTRPSRSWNDTTHYADFWPSASYMEMVQESAMQSGGHATTNTSIKHFIQYLASRGPTLPANTTKKNNSRRRL